MKFQLKKSMLLEARDYAVILLGCFIYAMAFNMFIDPNSIAPGGISGLAVILNRLTGWPIGLIIIAVNIPLFALSWKELGLEFGIKSLVATLAFSIMIDVFPMPAVVYDPLLASVFGGVLAGIGLGLVLRSNGSTGGTDIIGKLIHKFFPGLSIGSYILLADGLVIAGTWVFIGHLPALYSLICVFVSTKALDVLQEGIISAKTYYIISDRSKEIASRILIELDRGATFLKAQGSFTHAEKNVLMCLITRSEISRLRRIIKEEDEHAFVFVADAREVFGDGFSPRDRAIRSLKKRK